MEQLNIDEPPHFLPQGISHGAADTAIAHSNQFFTSTRQVTIPPAYQIGIDIDLAHADDRFSFRTALGSGVAIGSDRISCLVRLVKDEFSR